jgi:hypothetical protein
MKFEVYCDENYPDLLSSKKPHARYMVIGSLWLKAKDKDKFKEGIQELRDKHKMGGEFKWQKISPSRLGFYTELMNWFCGQGESLRFRCIAVARNRVNLIRYHDSDQELGFYKFYYQLLHHWIADFNEYAIFCDFKTNRHRDRLHVLNRCLSASNLSATITRVQAMRSNESVLIQLTDVLTGAASARLNASLTQDSAKSETVNCLERALDRRIKQTLKAEQKFNVFAINLQGGW